MMNVEFGPLASSLQSPSSNLRSSFIAFQKTICRSDIGFFHLNQNKDLFHQAKATHKIFEHKKIFVHVGIGGSSLGTEMLIESLHMAPFAFYSPKASRVEQVDKTSFYFLNNSDPQFLNYQWNSIQQHPHYHPHKLLFHIVSKSGQTLETLATFIIICQWLKDEGIEPRDWKNYFVFSTDPTQGDLRSLSQEYNIQTLTIPENIGGRFSVLSGVGIFPLFFTKASVHNLLQGAEDIKEYLLHTDFSKNILLQTAQYLNFYYEKGFNETVMMPYSSFLQNFSLWFCQLWAESLGKKTFVNGDILHKGFTPIKAVGATDQHSQLQLFMDGPLNKVIIFLKINQHQSFLPLNNHFQTHNFQKLSPYHLEQLYHAQLEGTLQGLHDLNRPTIKISIPSLNEKTLGAIILFFESLTVLIGELWNINSFDQPGVELSKRHTWSYVSKT